MMALLTVPQAVDILGVKDRFTVRRLIEKGVLVPTAYTGKRNQIALFDEAYLKQKAEQMREGRAA